MRREEKEYTRTNSTRYTKLLHKDRKEQGRFNYIRSISPTKKLNNDCQKVQRTIRECQTCSKSLNRQRHCCSTETQNIRRFIPY